MHTNRRFPPEKYYEACLTYHLVRYFQDIYEKALFPFCVSQVREKETGFDFGYRCADKSIFLVQYKRPRFDTAARYAWSIDLSQLNTLAGAPFPTFYALPAFSSAAQWYEGLEKTRFVPARRRQLFLRDRQKPSATLLHEGDALFLSVPKRAFDPFDPSLHSALAPAEPPPDGAVPPLSRLLLSDAFSGVLGYRIGG